MSAAYEELVELLDQRGIGYWTSEDQAVHIMIRLVATTGIFLNCPLLLAAGEHQADADSVTWGMPSVPADREN